MKKKSTMVHNLLQRVKRFIKWLLNPLYTRVCKVHVKLDFKWYESSGRWRARYYSRLFKECGNNLVVNGKPRIWHPEQISVGNHFTINDGAQIAPRGEVIIGDYVTMSRGSQITAGQLDVDRWMLEENTTRSHVSKPVFIADGTWLCVNSIILPGVSIRGKGCIIAAGAVVTSDINEDYVVVGGVPGKIVKRLNK